MSETTNTQDQDVAAADDVKDDVAASESTNDKDSTQPGQPDFAELDADNQPKGNSTDLSRLNDVRVTIAAELGRTTVPIHELLQLAEGTVFELNRSIENPVELRAQGVPLGNGEVVVVDGNFAIRIQEIYKNEPPIK